MYKNCKIFDINLYITQYFNIIFRKIPTTIKKLKTLQEINHGVRMVVKMLIKRR